MVDISEQELNPNTELDQHLNQALIHLKQAIDASVQFGLEDKENQKCVGQKWENMLSQFFGYARETGKANRVNLFNWISFSRIRR